MALKTYRELEVWREVFGLSLESHVETTKSEARNPRAETR